MTEKASAQGGARSLESEAGLELDPQAAEQRKRRAYRRLHAFEFPLFRFIGMSLIVLVVRLLPSGLDPGWQNLFPAICLGYCLVSWAILLAWERLGRLFLLLDVAVFCLTIYVTGAEQSWFIFVLIIRVADQIPTGPRRTLLFTHVNLAGYLAMLAVAAANGHPIVREAATEKALIVYLSGLYLSFSALQAKSLHDEAAGALRLARGLITDLGRRTHELEIANQTRTRFLANTSHELRTPMNGVLGMLDLTLDTPLTDQQRSFLGDARTSAGALLRVLNDILDLGKLEAGRLSLTVGGFDLPALLGELETDFAPRSTDGLTLELRLDPALPRRVQGDSARLSQILSHLLDNAFKFTSAGRIVLSATCEPASEGRVLLRAQVSDTGVGIGPEVIEAMFKPFVLGDDSLTRSQGGSGLGLALCLDLAHLMGGRLWAESLPERGSNFTLEVPVELEPTTEGAPRSLRVLVVEDNEVNQRVCTRMLEKLGHVVQVVSDGPAALALLESEAFDLVLMDVQMPGMDGLEVTRRLRAVGNQVPIVVLTAHATDGYREHCLEQGANDYLGKPLRLPQLKRLLHSRSLEDAGRTLGG